MLKSDDLGIDYNYRKSEVYLITKGVSDQVKRLDVVRGMDSHGSITLSSDGSCMHRLRINVVIFGWISDDV